jgi:hypothetical protein
MQDGIPLNTPDCTAELSHIQIKAAPAAPLARRQRRAQR